MRLAQLASLFIYGLIAKWYVAPWLKTLGRADALITLLWVHVFRYVALFSFSAQRDGFPISDVAALEIVVGDATGAVIALAAITALRSRTSLGVTLTWLLVVETFFDLIVIVHRRNVEPQRIEAGGVLWLILALYVPSLMVSMILLVRQLYSRRGEPLAGAQAGG
jgi:hypothetical protein